MRLLKFTEVKRGAEIHICVCRSPFCALYGNYASPKELIEMNEVTKCDLGKVFLYPKISPLCVLTVTKYRRLLFSL